MAPKASRKRYSIEKIKDRCFCACGCRKVMHLVKWEGYMEPCNTWESIPEDSDFAQAYRQAKPYTDEQLRMLRDGRKMCLIELRTHKLVKGEEVYPDDPVNYERFVMLSRKYGYRLE
jgi:hypothetical protein